jgi:hypothetical protein
MEVDKNDESTGFNEKESPQFDSLVESPSATRATIRACHSESLCEKYGHPMMRIEVMMDLVNMIAIILACGTVRFSKAQFE